MVAFHFLSALRCISSCLNQPRCRMLSLSSREICCSTALVCFYFNTRKLKSVDKKVEKRAPKHNVSTADSIWSSLSCSFTKSVFRPRTCQSHSGAAGLTYICNPAQSAGRVTEPSARPDLLQNTAGSF